LTPSGSDSASLTVAPAADTPPGAYTGTITVSDPTHTVTATLTVTVVAPTASGDSIVTAYDRIPNFGAHPTISAARSGNWSDPGTWGGRLPGAGDVVSIGADVTVTYDVVSDVPLKTVAIQPGGH